MKYYLRVYYNKSICYNGNMKKYWGTQTELTLNNFKIFPLKLPEIIIESLGLIKWAAAVINGKHDKVEINKVNLIKDVSWKIWEGEYSNQFPLSIWQSGSGTQSHMNVNEVIANIANENFKDKTLIHPNNDVNYGQSTNDTMVSAMHISTVIKLNECLKPALENIVDVFNKLTEKFGDIIKPGRTHFQDATLLTYKQEWSGYIQQFKNILSQLEYNIKNTSSLPQGGTAVGTGLNTFKGFDKEVVSLISKTIKIPFYVSSNKFSKIASHDDLLNVGSTINTLSTITNKIANDFRFLTSGPDCGVNEITFKANEAGSSIMAGKVNPTQCEMLSMASLHCMGSFNVISNANSNGHLQLNTYNPLIAYHLITSIEIISSAINSFSNNFLIDIKINKKQVNFWVNNSKMLSTILVPIIGYDNVSKIIKYSNKHNFTILETIVKLEILDKDEALKILDKQNMIGPEDNE